MALPRILATRVGTTVGTTFARRTFNTSVLRRDAVSAGVAPVVSASPLPARRPVGALRGGLFGFFLGSSLAAGAVYYYAVQEYKTSNELLTEDIYDAPARSGIVGPARACFKSPELLQLQPTSTPHQPQSTAMNNFGVIELSSTTTKNAPGWAYVPDTGPVVPSALQPANRKRARNQPALSLSDLSAREETRIRKDLEALDRDSHRDASIPIPPRPGGSRAQHKHTPNVRKILQSQKTFANHLDDYQALLALAESNPAAAAAANAAAARDKAATPVAVTAAAAASAASKSASPAPAPPVPEAETNPEPTADEQTQPAQPTDIEMTDAPATTEPDSTTTQTQNPPPPQPQAPQSPPQPQTYPRDSAILPAYAQPPPRPHPGDADPLLVSYIPPFPTDDELRALMTAPPLSYLEARAKWDDDGGAGLNDKEEDGGGGGGGGGGYAQQQRYPVRVFCAVCGYWGRVKCIKCGTRVCALDCLEAHREECVTRYGL
ncbi:uncharacterized protein C8A04DRAFT_35751 [Dichotomopilus funicola]|uniref:HIT-type domain-containing protein n=1 Tax=Dichotomopilus funicola TaxID=1934379 RepID=A0AAN6ZPQ4_9PEZI|nr:hypothetical protein C8A04DRAFT_35751 [Dichotomopilus funicola]